MMSPSDAQKEITKFFGEDSIFFDGNISTKYESISTGSPRLDEAIGIGGIPRGRITQFAGKESSGKTMLSLSCIKEYLDADPDNTALFIDAEYTYDPAWAAKQGVDTSRVMVIKTNDAKMIFEGLIGKVKVNKQTKKVSKAMKGILDHVIEGVDPRFKNLGIIVLDSIAVLNTPLEISADIGKANMAPIPRFLSTELKKLTPVIAHANIAFIGINQVRVDLGKMFGNPECVDPFTTRVKIRYEHITEEITLFEFAERFVKIDDMSAPNSFDISDLNLEIETKMSDGTIGFSPISKFFVKEKVDFYYQLGALAGSADHKVLVGEEYIRLADHPDAIRVDEELCIVDVSIPETENYIANGQVNHNSSPGGKALKHACSLMINMAPSFSSDDVIKSSDDTRIGHLVKAKVEKNKVGTPFTKAEYKIEYQKGVVQREREVFDLAIKYGLITRPSSQSYLIDGVKVRGADASFEFFRENKSELVEVYATKIRNIYLTHDPRAKDGCEQIIEDAQEENPLMAKI